MKYLFYIKNIIKYMTEGGVKYAPVSFVRPSGRFIGKRVLITGGSTGIGFEIAKEFLAEGAEVLITARREERLREAAKKLDSVNLHTMTWDLADTSCCDERLAKAVDNLGEINIFVNNAGIYKFEPWYECSEKTYNEVVDINAKGLFFICQAEASYLTQKKLRARIINICSRNSIDSGFDPYTVSKWEAACITRDMARKLIKDRIVVNGIAPGNVATNIHGDNVHNVSDNAYMPSHLTKRWVLTEEIASVALFLASDKANHIIGQIIPVDGGWTLKQ